MATPASAFVFKQEMDPTDLVEFQADLSGEEDSLLQTGELIASYTLTLLAESTAVGLTILNAIVGGNDYTMKTPGNNSIQFWMEVDPGFRDNVAYDGAGTKLPMVLTVTTNSTPPRRLQRTMVVGVAQK